MPTEREIEQLGNKPFKPLKPSVSFSVENPEEIVKRNELFKKELSKKLIKMERICFNCGEKFTGEGVICDSCKSKTAIKSKKKKSFSFSVLFNSILLGLQIIVSLIMM